MPELNTRAGGAAGFPLTAAPPLEPKGETQMDFTETEQEILVNCWLLAREGRGQVLEPWAEPDAQELADAGWLERRTIDGTGIPVGSGRCRPKGRST